MNDLRKVAILVRALRAHTRYNIDWSSRGLGLEVWDTGYQEVVPEVYDDVDAFVAFATKALADRLAGIVTAYTKDRDEIEHVLHGFGK